MPEYFVAVTLPDQIGMEVERWRRRFRAPKTPPHLTLIAPFQWDLDEQKLIEVLRVTAQCHRPFDILCQGLGHFGRAVIFIDVNPSQALLSLQSDLARNLQEIGVKPEERPFHPHITLATRLRGNQYDLCRVQLMDYNPRYSFRCSTITLFILAIEGKIKRWQEACVLPLKE